MKVFKKRQEALFRKLNVKNSKQFFYNAGDGLISHNAALKKLKSYKTNWILLQR